MTSRETVDRPTFEEWVDAHSPALARFALLVVGDQAGADDALQEALSRAYPRWDRIVRADNPNAYVRRMIVNAHISWWRRARRRETPFAGPLDTGASDGAAVAEASEGLADADELWALCLGLPQKQRAAVVLRFYEGLSYAEVAELLGTTEVTARTQTHRALNTLRGALQENVDD
jgi:RNA polymerase sigma-70 factor (sigma-E family)